MNEIQNRMSGKADEHRIAFLLSQPLVCSLTNGTLASIESMKRCRTYNVGRWLERGINIAANGTSLNWRSGMFVFLSFDCFGKVHKWDRWTRRTFAWLLKEGERHSGMEFSARKRNWEKYFSFSMIGISRQMLENNCGPGRSLQFFHWGISLRIEGLDFFLSPSAVGAYCIFNCRLSSGSATRTIPFNKPWKREGYHHLHICHLLA